MNLLFISKHFFSTSFCNWLQSVTVKQLTRSLWLSRESTGC